ncbi:MAG: VOC family protein [Blastocatellales bacterium]
MEISKHEPGSFCWIELGSADQEGARRFYSNLFGWQSSDTPVGPDTVYTIFNIDGSDVAALYQLQKEQLESGIPSNWMLYIATDDADRTAEAVKAAGGTLVMDPFDVMEEGRMFAAVDPTGAMFSCWQPRNTIGVKRINESNTLCWQELQTHDLATAEKFYATVFGWSSETKGSGIDTYVEFYAGDPAEHRTRGGMMQIREEWGNVPPNWSVYFAVDDCDATAAKAETLGGKIIFPPSDIPNVGRFSVIQDPSGAVFSIIRLMPM